MKGSRAFAAFVLFFLLVGCVAVLYLCQSIVIRKMDNFRKNLVHDICVLTSGNITMSQREETIASLGRHFDELFAYITWTIQFH